MEKMHFILKTIENIMLKEVEDSNKLSSYSAVRILLNDLRLRANSKQDEYHGICNINDRILHIELHLLHYFNISKESGYHEDQVGYLLNNDLGAIKTILDRYKDS